jgi:hypothetical protein
VQRFGAANRFESQGSVYMSQNAHTRHPYGVLRTYCTSRESAVTSLTYLSQYTNHAQGQAQGLLVLQRRVRQRGVLSRLRANAQAKT